MFCYGCGKKIHKTAKSCPSCGAQQRGFQGEKSRIAAALLAFFFGGLGVHKFYLRKFGFGFLYLVFFWTLIPSIIAFFECIIYLCESDEKFETRYIQSKL